MTTQYLYLPADEVQAGDVLPNVSRFPVASVVVFPNESVRFTFTGSSFVRHAPYGGPEFGYECFHVVR